MSASIWFFKLTIIACVIALMLYITELWEKIVKGVGKKWVGKGKVKQPSQKDGRT